MARRAAALVVVGTATLHLVLAAQRGFDVLGVVLLMMACVCARCAHVLWTSAGRRTWLTTACNSAAMGFVHVAGCSLVAADVGMSMPMSGHETAMTGSLVAGWTPLDRLVLALAVIETIAGLLGWALTGRVHHSPGPEAAPGFAPVLAPGSAPGPAPGFPPTFALATPARAV